MNKSSGELLALSAMLAVIAWQFFLWLLLA
jgi:hypothetical protein